MHGYRIKWVSAHQFHLTLFFFGDTDSHTASLLSSQILTIVSHTTSFPYTLTEPGIFTSNRQPQVLWLGVDAPVHLQHLKQAVDAMAVSLGFKADNRPFKPHLTLGRFRPGQPIPPPTAYRITPYSLEQNTRITISGSSSINIPGSSNPTKESQNTSTHSPTLYSSASRTSSQDMPTAPNSAVDTSTSKASAQDSGPIAVPFPIPCLAARLMLYESRLTPSGPIYKPLCEAPLKT